MERRADLIQLQTKEMAFFVQDDWKVNSDLTLNIGLRYDLFSAPTERFDRQSNFNPATGRIDVAVAKKNLLRAFCG